MGEIRLTKDGKTRDKTVVHVRRDGRLFHSDRVVLTDAADRGRFIGALKPKLLPEETEPDAGPTLERWLLDLIEQPDESETEAVGADPPADTGPADPAEAVRQQAREELDKTPAAVVADAREMLSDPNLLARVVRDFEVIELFGETELAASVYLIGTSRLLRKPLAGIVYGPTSSGKSYVSERVATLFPPGATLTAHHMTEKALAYMPPGRLAHRWIVAGERSRAPDDERAEATRMLRELIQSGHLVIQSSQRVGDQITTIEVRQDGPVAYTESTTLEDVFDEDSNRTIALRTDDSEAQTRLIIRKYAERKAGGRAAVADRTQAVHRAAQLLLQERFTGADVVVPFAPQIADQFDCSRVDSRRHFAHLVALTSAVALLHGFQREQEDGQIVAAPADYEVAARLAQEPFKKVGGGLSPALVKFLDRLRTRFTTNEFSSVNARFGEAVGKTTVDGWLGKLVDEGLLEQTYASRGGRGNPSKFQLVQDAETKSGLKVPQPSEVFSS